MIKIGRMTHPIRNLMGGINKTLNMGFDYVELGIEPINDAQFIHKNKKLIKKLLKKFSHLPIIHTAWWYDLSSPYDEIRKAWIKRGCADINIANELGAKLINFHFMVHSGALLKYKNSKKMILDNYVKSLKYLCNYADKIMVEVMFENGEEKFEDYKYVLDNVSKLKVHFDVGHAFISGGMRNIKRFFYYFNDRIVHIHIHDNHGKQDEHLALKKGKINWKQVVSILKKSRYDKTITFEVFKSDKDLLKSREYFRKLW